MKKVDKLNLRLKKLEEQEIYFSSFDNISIFQFLKYKKNNQKKSQIKEKIQRINSKAKEINSVYESTIKKWIESSKINCRKYHLMQQKAQYVRDLKLYKIGYIEKRPLSPFIKNIISHLPQINCSQIIFFKKIQKSHSNFNSKSIQATIDTLAINATKSAIRGYRNFCSGRKYIFKCITSMKSYRHIQNIILEAKSQIDQAEYQKIQICGSSKKGVQFRESLKYTPIPAGIIQNHVTGHKKRIPFPSSKRNIILHEPAEYTL